MKGYSLEKGENRIATTPKSERALWESNLRSGLLKGDDFVAGIALFQKTSPTPPMRLILGLWLLAIRKNWLKGRDLLFGHAEAKRLREIVDMPEGANVKDWRLYKSEVKDKSIPFEQWRERQREKEKLEYEDLRKKQDADTARILARSAAYSRAMSEELHAEKPPVKVQLPQNDLAKEEAAAVKAIWDDVRNVLPPTFGPSGTFFPMRLNERGMKKLARVEAKSGKHREAPQPVPRGRSSRVESDRQSYISVHGSDEGFVSAR